MGSTGFLGAVKTRVDAKGHITTHHPDESKSGKKPAGATTNSSQPPTPLTVFAALRLFFLLMTVVFFGFYIDGVTNNLYMIAASAAFGIFGSIEVFFSASFKRQQKKQVEWIDIADPLLFSWIPLQLMLGISSYLGSNDYNLTFTLVLAPFILYISLRFMKLVVRPMK